MYTDVHFHWVHVFTPSDFRLQHAAKMFCAFPDTLLSDKYNNSKPIISGFSWPKYF